ARVFELAQRPICGTLRAFPCLVCCVLGALPCLVCDVFGSVPGLAGDEFDTLPRCVGSALHTCGRNSAIFLDRVSCVAYLHSDADCAIDRHGFRADSIPDDFPFVPDKTFSCLVKRISYGLISDSVLEAVHLSRIESGSGLQAFATERD